MRIKFEKVFEQERKFIEARRKNKTKNEIDTAQSGLESKNLVGLAISGGGIRSATFGLGVLEALKQKGLLKKIDYLSTVSGGGYIGAWLSANCHQNKDKDWLDKEKESEEGSQWRDSIAHLRRYSNYLSPNKGLLSADAWSMATVWLKNTLLIQIMILLFITCLLLFAKGFFYAEELFYAIGSFYAEIINKYFNLTYTDITQVSQDIAEVIAALLLCMVTFCITFCLINLKRTLSDPPPRYIVGQTAIQLLVIVLMVTSFVLSFLIWVELPKFSFWLQAQEYWYVDLSLDRLISLFGTNWTMRALLLWVYLSSVLFAYCSIINSTNKIKKILCSLVMPVVPTAASLLLFTIMLFVVEEWKTGCDCNSGKFLVFASMPTVLLLTFSFATVLLIGMLGRDSSDYFREWWSRFGAWLAIYGFTWVIVVVVIYLGPWIIEEYNMREGDDIWDFIAVNATWVGTTIAGLFAGKSADTSGADYKGISTKLKEIIAKVAPVIFIFGLLTLISVMLHLFMGAHSNVHFNFESLILAGDLGDITIAFVICAVGVLIFAWRVDINEFSLNAFYRHRLARCFLGASRQPGERKPHPFTGFDAKDDIKLAELLDEKKIPRGPLHIINCALNLGGSSDLSLHTRHSSIFTLTPLSCGSSYLIKNQDGTVRQAIGYVATKDYCGSDAQPTLGQGISVSGAAASPNSGYHTSGPVAFLLTLFNVRLGWWFPNPSESECKVPSPYFSLKYILLELFGCANEKSKFLAVSDGGHFENLAAYELIKRKCEVIIISDGECDPELQFEGLANLIRICKVDGLAEIDIDTRAIRSINDGWSHRRWAVGEIKYKNNNIAGPETGYLIYLKASMNGYENISIQQYKSVHPNFPHETTGDQFYAEDQFECYRSLGKEITKELFNKIGNTDDVLQIAKELYRINTPQLIDDAQFIQYADRLMEIWRQLGTDKDLELLAKELRASESMPSQAVFYMCNEMIQLMENVYLGIDLEETWHHPDNEGWRQLFISWARNESINAVWEKTGETYGERFVSFWDRNLIENKLH